jgi:predicted ArsR family transcriptional regulator
VATEDFVQGVAGVAALAEPIRRELYLYVVAQPEAVSRDQASAGVGVARHTAKFHLDKLVEEGLLEADFKRLSDRRGPGAGRPTKLYRRSERQLSVSLPERRYDLAGQLLARAIDDSASGGASVVEALDHAAAEVGAALGDQARAATGSRPSRERLVAAAGAALAAQGYEPRRHGDTITLANCPFHTLAREHTELVCGMNLSLIDAMAQHLTDGKLGARLDPAADRCCVVLAPK